MARHAWALILRRLAPTRIVHPAVPIPIHDISVKIELSCRGGKTIINEGVIHSIQQGIALLECCTLERVLPKSSIHSRERNQLTAVCRACASMHLIDLPPPPSLSPSNQREARKFSLSGYKYLAHI
jgi:hypothetical protein